MITKDIPTDIRKHKTELFFGFSTRECASIALAVFICYGIIHIEKTFFHMEVLNYYFCLPCIIPLFFGFWKDSSGLTLEKYLKINFVYVFLAPKERIYKINNIYSSLVSSSYIDDETEEENNPEIAKTENEKKEKSKKKKDKKKKQKGNKANTDPELIGYV